MRYFFAYVSLICILAGHINVAWPQDLTIGQPIVLQAKKSVGVPVHREPSPSYLKHLPEGTTGIIRDRANKTPWLFIEVSSGETYWVHRKYIRSDTSSSPSVTQQEPSPAMPSGESMKRVGGDTAVWSGQQECQAALQEGFRMTTISASTLRVATWNLRWFPIGHPPEQPQQSAEPTDLEWLVCAIRWMSIDILAIQESLATTEAMNAWKKLTRQLSSETGAPWRWHRQPCGRTDDHHIGLLWNDARVSLSNFQSLWQLNAKASSHRNPCTSGLRPGQYAFVQSRQKDGVDFHLISVHLKSGPTVFGVEVRQKALNRIDKAVAPLLTRDQDIVILGDFNTMGAGDWHSQKSELKYLRRFVRKEKPGFTDLPVRPQCSQYFRGRGGQLDHVLVAHGMEEISVESVHSTGYCAVSGCKRIKGDYPLAYHRLSDHCPIVLEISNRDQD